MDAAERRPAPDDAPAPSIAAHLRERYDVDVTATRELDAGVHRIDRGDGPPWVARVLPAARPLADVRGRRSCCAGSRAPASRPSAARMRSRCRAGASAACS